MRTRLSELLVAHAKSDPKVIVLTADHGYSLFNDLRRECPDQFLNVGIMEQCMIGVAAGLARQGFKPIVYGLACFLTRAYEQIKLDICLPKLSVMLIADGCGESYETLGPTHQCPEWADMFGGVLDLDMRPALNAEQMPYHWNSLITLMERGNPTCLCIVPPQGNAL